MSLKLKYKWDPIVLQFSNRSIAKGTYCIIIIISEMDPATLPSEKNRISEFKGGYLFSAYGFYLFSKSDFQIRIENFMRKSSEILFFNKISF